jgi:hypothetical protein
MTELEDLKVVMSERALVMLAADRRRWLAGRELERADLVVDAYPSGYLVLKDRSRPFPYMLRGALKDDALVQYIVQGARRVLKGAGPAPGSIFSGSSVTNARVLTVYYRVAFAYAPETEFAGIRDAPASEWVHDHEKVREFLRMSRGAK